MDIEQFNDITKRLDKWRKERHLTKEGQREGFLGNAFEEVSEYFRAKDDLERIDALCDMAVFCFNAFDIKYIVDYEYRSYEEYSIIKDIINDFSISTNNNKLLRLDELAYKTIYKIEHLCDILGFDFHKCMLETINEIDSRTGHYDTKINKFIKDKGAYTLKEAKKHFFMSYIYKEDKDFWYFLTLRGKKKIKKWHKARYYACKV